MAYPLFGLFVDSLVIQQSVAVGDPVSEAHGTEQRRGQRRIDDTVICECVETRAGAVRSGPGGISHPVGGQIHTYLDREKEVERCEVAATGIGKELVS